MGLPQGSPELAAKPTLVCECSCPQDLGVATTVGGDRQVLGKQAVHERDSSTLLNWTQDQHRPTSMSEIPSAPQDVCHTHTLPPSGNGTLPPTGPSGLVQDL